jgi:hypothetical protein
VDELRQLPIFHASKQPGPELSFDDIVALAHRTLDEFIASRRTWVWSASAFSQSRHSALDDSLTQLVLAASTRRPE